MVLKQERITKCECGSRVNKACNYKRCARCCSTSPNGCRVHHRQMRASKRDLMIQQVTNRLLFSTLEMCLGRNITTYASLPTEASVDEDVCDDLSVADLKTRITCGICMNRVKRIVYSCGHALCFECFDHEQKRGKLICHICRRESVQAINLFL